MRREKRRIPCTNCLLGYCDRAPLDFHWHKSKNNKKTVEKLNHFPALSSSLNSKTAFPYLLSVAVEGHAIGTMIKHCTRGPWRQEPCPNPKFLVSLFQTVAQSNRKARSSRAARVQFGAVTSALFQGQQKSREVPWARIPKTRLYVQRTQEACQIQTPGLRAEGV